MSQCRIPGCPAVTTGDDFVLSGKKGAKSKNHACTSFMENFFYHAGGYAIDRRQLCTDDSSAV